VKTVFLQKEELVKKQLFLEIMREGGDFAIISLMARRKTGC
jgi:hypothetical protein